MINKVDRLIVELKLPPTRPTHFKLCHTLDDVNAKIAEAWDAAALRLDLEGDAPRLSPVDGNVLLSFRTTWLDLQSGVVRVRIC